MITKELLEEANSLCNPIDIGRSKKYVEVNERIKALRSVLPDASIVNELIYNANGSYIVKSSIIIDGVVIAEGHAQESVTSYGVNSTSALENCETSAVGRALAFLGIGVDEAIASAQEVTDAIKKQNELQEKVTDKEVEELKSLIFEKDINGEKLLKQMNKKDYTDFTKGEFVALKAKMEGAKKHE